MQDVSFLKTLKPIVLKDVFTPEQYKHIYDSVNSVFPKELAPDVPSDVTGYKNEGQIGYFSYTKGFDDIIYKQIVKVVEEATGIKIYDPRVHFARYTTKTGYPPTLLPHNDMGVKNPAITLSIQLDSSFDWELCAYDTCDTISKNEAMLFSGSHQIHWRPVKEFGQEDYFDIMVCQLHINNDGLSEEHWNEMHELKKQYVQQYAIDNKIGVHNIQRIENVTHDQFGEM